MEGKLNYQIKTGVVVNSIKGSAETNYRTGNVEVTPENLGITVVNNTEDAEKSVKEATKLTTGRNISITGAVTGTATQFDGSQDIAISTTVDATKLSGQVPISNVHNYEAALNDIKQLKIDVVKSTPILWHELKDLRDSGQLVLN